MEKDNDDVVQPIKIDGGCCNVVGRIRLFVVVLSLSMISRP